MCTDISLAVERAAHVKVNSQRSRELGNVNDRTFFSFFFQKERKKQFLVIFIFKGICPGTFPCVAWILLLPFKFFSFFPVQEILALYFPPFV